MLPPNLFAPNCYVTGTFTSAGGATQTLPLGDPIPIDTTGAGIAVGTRTSVRAQPRGPRTANEMPAVVARPTPATVPPPAVAAPVPISRATPVTAAPQPAVRRAPAAVAPPAPPAPPVRRAAPPRPTAR